MTTSPGNIIKLPTPQTRGTMSLEETISRRRSVRNFTQQSLSLSQLSQLLWAAQGITEPGLGFRAIPSAGATFPLELYVVTGRYGVKGLNTGLYHYEVPTHSLRQLKSEEMWDTLAVAALGQKPILQAPVTFIVGAVYERISTRYRQRAERYAAMEAGHLGQNIHLEAIALGLATVMIGAFDDNEVASVLGLDRAVAPLYIMPVGYPAR